MFGSGEVHTGDTSLDLTGITSSIPIYSTNTAGTTFTTDNAQTASEIRGGAGDDTLIYTNATPLTDTQRADIFAQGSVEVIQEGSVQYAANVTAVTLYAGPTGSTLNAGGAGGTTLVSGNGNDTLIGGPGATDTFVFHPSFGQDTIVNFQASGPNQSVLQFDQTVFADTAAVLNAAHQNGANVVITDPHNANNTVTLLAVDVHSLSQSDFHIV